MPQDGSTCAPAATGANGTQNAKLLDGAVDAADQDETRRAVQHDTDTTDLRREHLGAANATVQRRDHENEVAFNRYLEQGRRSHKGGAVLQALVKRTEILGWVSWIS
jgi:hypothetical protein